jgi:hypothetical protein
MPELVVEEALPNPLDGRVSLVLHAAEVVIHFSRLVQQPLLEPRLGGVDDRLVLRGYPKIKSNKSDSYTLLKA